MKNNNRDDIILQQMETIRVLTENNLRRMGDDFWGASAPKTPEKPAAPEKPKTPEQSKAPEQPAAAAEEVPPPEKMEDLQA